MRMLSLVVVLCVLTGCSNRLSSVRRTYSAQFHCPVDEVDAWKSGSRYEASGCGYTAVCAGPSGPCREPTEVLMQRAQATFARETSCPVAYVQVFVTNEGVAAQGCERYAVCPGSGAACFTRQPPTCGELAQSEYNACVADAREVGRSGRRGYGSTAWAVTSAVTTTVLEGKGMNHCRANYESQVARCQGGGSSVAP